jgi:hypothetical protein
VGLRVDKAYFGFQVDGFLPKIKNQDFGGLPADPERWGAGLFFGIRLGKNRR